MTRAPVAQYIGGPIELLSIGLRGQDSTGSVDSALRKLYGRGLELAGSGDLLRACRHGPIDAARLSRRHHHPSEHGVDDADQLLRGDLVSSNASTDRTDGMRGVEAMNELGPHTAEDQSQQAPVVVVPCKTAKEFYELLLPTNSLWGNDLRFPWLFRGHWDARWSLSPKAWRSDGQATLKPVITSFRNHVETNWDRYKRDLESSIGGTWPKDRTIDVLTQVGAESQAVYEFSLLADELGLHIPEGTSAFTDSGLAAINSFTEGQGAPRSTAYAYAQHHGVPTRYLDVTRRSLVAAYFAAQSECDEHNERIAVWALNTEATSTIEIEIIGNLGTYTVTCPRSQHSFLHAQDGLFVGISGAERYYLDQGRWPSLVDAVEEKCSNEKSAALIEFTLPASEGQELRRLLWRERISQAHLMPSYDNVTSTLLDKWRGFA